MTYESNYISHHGIKGQKWGVRRYQNKNGSLTSEGKRRYGSSASKFSLKKRDMLKLTGRSMLDSAALLSAPSFIEDMVTLDGRKNKVYQKEDRTLTKKARKQLDTLNKLNLKYESLKEKDKLLTNGMAAFVDNKKELLKSHSDVKRNRLKIIYAKSKVDAVLDDFKHSNALLIYSPMTHKYRVAYTEGTKDDTY